MLVPDLAAGLGGRREKKRARLELAAVLYRRGLHQEQLMVEAELVDQRVLQRWAEMEFQMKHFQGQTGLWRLLACFRRGLQLLRLGCSRRDHLRRLA